MASLLILGGTNFIGRNLVEQLLELGEHDITLFNRQKTNTDLFPSVNKIKGDRETNDIEQIRGQKWDYIIDLSCYYPRALENVLKEVSDLENYIFVSTCSVYDNENDQTILRSEKSKILSCDDEQKIDENPRSYGNRKAECERILKNSAIPYTILRPALVYGKYDPTDRLYYWLYQVHKQNQLLLPENGRRLFSTTYVADLIEVIVQSVKTTMNSSTYNVISTPQTSIKQIVQAAANDLNITSIAENVSAEFLQDNNIKEWVDMPLWIHGDHFTYDNSKLIRDYRISLTPFNQSIKNTIAYYEKLNWPEPQFGIDDFTRTKLIDKIGDTT